MILPKSFGTHDGSFHADEVTACALLLHYGLIDRSAIVRTRDPDILRRCEFVCDVGGEYEPGRKRFDHHQLSYTGELSGAGMIWLYLLERGIVNRSRYDFLNHSLIRGVDAHDNGKTLSEPGVCTFSHIIAGFIPTRYDVSDEEMDFAFFSAVDFVKEHIARMFDRFEYTCSCREKVRIAMEQGKDFLLFEESMPWIDGFFELDGERHPALFVVMPAGKHWKVRGIPPVTGERMKVRMPMPLEWAGLLEPELKAVSGIRGAIFCHKGRFISVWETKEDALLALNYILSKRRET